MLLTLSTTRKPATDLGFLLHKNPERAQSVDVSAGRAHVFHPEATAERCTVALLLEVDPFALVRGSWGTAAEGFCLGQYVNDRPLCRVQPARRRPRGVGLVRPVDPGTVAP